MSHGRIIFFDMSLRDAWYQRSKLSAGMLVHGWWKRSREFDLTAGSYD